MVFDFTGQMDQLVLKAKTSGLKTLTTFSKYHVALHTFI
jgi:hypothetical protein